MATILRSENAEAILWVTAGTAVFSIVFASGKFAGDAASTLQILFLRYVGGFSTLVVVMLATGGRFSQFRSSRPASHFLRALVGAYGGVALIHASANMPIVDATAIGLLYVIFMIVLGVWLLGERITAQHWGGITLCAAGAALVMGSRGAFRSFDITYLWPAAIALGGAVLLALEGILIKTLTRSDRPLTVLLHVNFFGIFLLAVPAFLTWRSTGLVDNLPFLLLGPVGITAQYFIIRGYRMADVSVLGPVDYSWLIFAALIGFAFFQEVPTIGAVFGSAVIAAGGVVLALLNPSDPRTRSGLRE
jgi:drug/metabolite transporter (DMT)-like permease